MLGTPYYHRILKKHVIAFGDMFNNITLRRFDSAGVEAKRITVPIQYAPKLWYFAKLKSPAQEPEITLPRMAFEIVGMQYDGQRKLNSLRRISKTVNDTSRNRVYAGNPYNIQFALAIYVRNSDDGTQIVEQILPFFGPSFNVTVKTIPDMDVLDDVPLVINGVTKYDQYEGNIENLQVQMWTLNFTMKSTFYGPVTTQGVIKKVQVDTHVGSGDRPWTAEEMATTPRHLRYTVEPDPVDAEPEDDYGFTEVWETFDDGKKYDPVTDTDVEIE